MMQPVCLIKDSKTPVRRACRFNSMRKQSTGATLFNFT